jgi:hypothetical protein
MMNHKISELTMPVGCTGDSFLKYVDHLAKDRENIGNDPKHVPVGRKETAFRKLSKLSPISTMSDIMCWIPSER